MEKQISWSAPEFHYYEKGPRWYWGLAGVATAIVVIALFQQNFLFALFAVVAAILTSIWGARTPRTITFTLTDKGLDMSGRKFYSYDDFSGFSVIPLIAEDEALAEIVLRGKGFTGSWVRIIVPREQLPEVHAALESKLSELEHQESIAEHVARILRF